MAFEKAFSAAEYQGRVADVKGRMAKAGIDLLICEDPANMSWLTGFDGWSFYTPQAVVVHVDQDEPIWFGRAQDAKSAVITTDLSADNIISFSERLVHHPEEHAFDELCDLIKSRGWEKARVGVELDALYYTARAHHHIVKGLPLATITDSRELVNWARLVKSDAELVYMREAGHLVTKVMNEAIGLLRPGVPENEIIAEVYQSQVRGIDGKHGDYASCVPLIQVGEGTSTPHLTWTSSPLPDSGLVVMELAGVRRHYHAPLSRTISIGKPGDDVRRLADAIVEGGDAALAAAKAGTVVEDVEATWQAILRKYGYRKDSRVGYSIGINFPPDWGEKTVSIRPGEKTVLQSGMCFHFQSGVWLEDYGVAISESFVVTERGGERLTNVDRRLFTV
ncbi:Xaa-Pro peptidase family protein [Pararhizobium sp. YC-54]|uniref:M24 family metallopeptidase n=1 Tax=Pararhizobium sp. YC-54 TaxID=2986920 RepID=UPI0021F6E81C|nr:Xaa-Pro peptidase family protein [Pararhizobium sp. YC-54]MCW0001875.1 Xaa-Pro peptidase family protein [Pararhizobium sp. YC-54]